MRIFYFSRWKAIGIGLLAAFLFWYFSHPVVLQDTAQQVSVLFGQRIIPIYSVGTAEKKIALSFDATWGADQTPELLRILRENQVRTTFFSVAFGWKNIRRWSRKLPLKGHELANRSYSHPHMNNLSERELHELNRTHN